MEELEKEKNRNRIKQQEQEKAKKKLMEKREKELEKEKEKKKKEKNDKEQERQKLHEERAKQKEKQKNLEKDKKREFNEKENERLLAEKQRELEEKELEKERNREKEREKLDREFERKKERDNEKREGHLKAKEELDREKEERDKMKLKEKEDKDRQREKEKEAKDKMREKEKDERKRQEEKNRKDREEKERMKQKEKEEKYKQKEERDKQRLKEREEREKEKKREKEKREKEKQKLRDERKRYNERFQNGNYKLLSKNLGKSNSKSRVNPPFNLHQTRSQGNYYQRQAYNSKRLFVRKRRFSHRRIQPKNRIPSIEPKKKLGKTSMKIIKPKKYDEDETDTELTDFDDQLMKFPRFKAKYGKNFILKKPNKNKFVNLTSYISNHSGKNIIDYKRPEMERKMGDTKKTNLTISEVEEEEEKNVKKRKPLSKVKPKNAKLNMNKKMKEILGKQYKLLVNDPLNPYGTFWPSNFLKVGYDTGFEYENFQSGVPVLKLKSLGKKQLPPLKKRGQGLHFNNDGSGIYSPNKIGNKHPLFPNTTAKKNINDESGKDDKDLDNIRVNKSQTIKVNGDKLLKDKNNNNE